MSDKIPCENIKKDLEYLDDIIVKQTGREPTPDVSRWRTQVMYKKELCKMRKES